MCRQNQWFAVINAPTSPLELVSNVTSLCINYCALNNSLHRRRSAAVADDDDDVFHGSSSYRREPAGPEVQSLSGC